MTTRAKSERTKLFSFARRLLIAWKALGLPSSDDTVVIAVSGGADSAALLLATEELITARQLRIKVVVAHLDHGLRPESRGDAAWVKGLAARLNLEYVSGRVAVARRARATGDNLEQAARRARYDFLSKTARKVGAHSVLTAHTMDDQAETVLLRLLRGSGTDGIAGIEPVRQFDARSNLLLARPLLTWARRSDTEGYCRQRKIAFLTDVMNEDEEFARVRVRRQLVPLLQSFNPKVVEALSRTAELLRDELDVLCRQADSLLEQARVSDDKSETKRTRLSVRVLAEAPVAVRRRALRQWLAQGRGDLRRCELVHIQGIERLLQGEQGGRVAEIPGGGKVVRVRSWIELVITPR